MGYPEVWLVSRLTAAAILAQYSSGVNGWVAVFCVSRAAVSLIVRGLFTGVVYSSCPFLVVSLNPKT